MSDDTNANDSVEIVIRSAESVARRCIVLLAAMQRIGLGESTPSLQGDDPAAVAYDTREWLRAEGLWEELTPGEAELLGIPYSPIDLFDIQERGLQTEAFAALAWSLGLINELSDGDRTSYGEILAGMPAPWEKTAPWVEAQTLRPELKIALRREQAEIWEWRLAMEPIRRLLKGRELMELETSIVEVVHDGTAQGLLKPGRKGGFSIEGESLTRLQPFALEELHVLAQERLTALNWVCGHGSDWDDAPLDIEGLSLE